MKKGIFCLEGNWEHNLKDKSSVLPILELLERKGNCNFIYRDCATPEQFEYYLGRWKHKTVSDKYPILYLAFHGNKECIRLPNGSEYSLEELGTILESACERKVIFFASCETLKIDQRKINSFLTKTNAIAVIGYKKAVDWMVSTAFEFLVLNALQDDQFDSKGICKIATKIESDYGKLHKILDLRIVINKEHFPRKRKLDVSSNNHA